MLVSLRKIWIDFGWKCMGFLSHMNLNITCGTSFLLNRFVKYTIGKRTDEIYYFHVVVVEHIKVMVLRIDSLNCLPLQFLTLKNQS